jgi:NAD(P)-dependent dehydrogenase (short-subunit alcohol dehydrogenase family)
MWRRQRKSLLVCYYCLIQYFAHPLSDVPGLEIVKVELDSLASVNAAADEFLSRSAQLNILINNAGVMNCSYSQTKDGHEFQFGVNHLAHFLLFKRYAHCAPIKSTFLLN